MSEPEIITAPYYPAAHEFAAAKVEYGLCVAACGEFYDLGELARRTVDLNTVPKSRVRNLGGTAIKLLSSVHSTTSMAERVALQPGFQILGGGSEVLVLTDPSDPDEVMKIFGKSIDMFYPFKHDLAADVEAGHAQVTEQFGDLVLPTRVSVEHELPFRRGGKVSAVVARQPRINPQFDILQDLLISRDMAPLATVAWQNPELAADLRRFSAIFSYLVSESRYSEIPDMLGRLNVVAIDREGVLRLAIIDAQTPASDTPNNVKTAKKAERTQILANDLEEVVSGLRAT